MKHFYIAHYTQGSRSALNKKQTNKQTKQRQNKKTDKQTNKQNMIKPYANYINTYLVT